MKFVLSLGAAFVICNTGLRFFDGKDIRIDVFALLSVGKSLVAGRLLVIGKRITDFLARNVCSEQCQVANSNQHDL